MTLPNRKARAAGGDRRAEGEGAYINDANIIPQDAGKGHKSWFKMLFDAELRMLVERHASAHEIVTYCALTRFDDLLDNPHHVAENSIAEDTGLTVSAVNTALHQLQRKGIIRSVHGPYPGQEAEYMVCPPSRPATHSENDMCSTATHSENDMCEGTRDDIPESTHCENDMRPGGTHSENSMLKEYNNNTGAAAPLTVTADPTPKASELTAAERTKEFWRGRGHHE